MVACAQELRKRTLTALWHPSEHVQRSISKRELNSVLVRQATTHTVLYVQQQPQLLTTKKQCTSCAAHGKLQSGPGVCVWWRGARGSARQRPALALWKAACCLVVQG